MRDHPAKDGALMTLPTQDIVERLPIEKQIKYALFLAAGQDDPHSVTITELCASLSRLTADNEALRKTNEHWRRQSRDSFEAFSAMRDAINEVVPMQSAEADLLDGPELFVSCEAVALAVVSRVTALEADVGRLRALLAEAVPTINAVERLRDIRSAGYPREEDENRLCIMIETFCGDVGRLLETANA